MRPFLARFKPSRQKLIVCAGLALFALTLIQAPWEIDTRNYKGAVIGSRNDTAPVWGPPPYHTSRLRIEVLAVEWFAIAVGCGGAWFLARRVP